MLYHKMNGSFEDSMLEGNIPAPIPQNIQIIQPNLTWYYVLDDDKGKKTDIKLLNQLNNPLAHM